MDKENKIKISIIGTVGVPACYGGFESLVDNLLDHTPQNVQYTVFCSGLKYQNRLETYKGAKLVYLEKDANGISSIFYDFESMKKSLDCDIMLVLGVSGCIFLPYIRRKFNGKIITNIDGLEWKRDKWKFYAKWLLHTSEKMAVKYSDVIIGDNKGITDYVHSEYKKIVKNKRVELIAYGGDQVSKVTDDSLYEKYPFCREPYAATVCRIEPENNVHKIIEAFAKANNVISSDSEKSIKNLVIVGNWKNSEYVSELQKKYADFSNIHLLDPIYEPHTINWIRSNASLYIHGHSAGGTNPSLVEAMNLELPIFAFDCVYNRETTQNQCLYWKDETELLELITKTDSEKLLEIKSKMAESGKNLYNWKRIAEQYNSLY